MKDEIVGGVQHVLAELESKKAGFFGILCQMLLALLVQQGSVFLESPEPLFQESCLFLVQMEFIPLLIYSLDSLEKLVVEQSI